MCVPYCMKRNFDNFLGGYRLRTIMNISEFFMSDLYFQNNIEMYILNKKKTKKMLCVEMKIEIYQNKSYYGYNLFI